MDIGDVILAYVAPLGMCTVGAVFVALSLLSRRTERRRRDTGAVVLGRVVGSETVRPRQSGASIAHAVEAPVVSFVDDTGVERTFREQVGSNLPVTVGRTVEVWFDPENLETHPVVLDSGPRRLLDLVQGGLGTAVFLAGAAWLASSLS